MDRPGAYAETCLAIRRVHAAGLRAAATSSWPRRTRRRPSGCWGLAAAGDRRDVVWAGDLLPDGASAPQRAPAPGAVGPAPARRPDPPAEPVRSRCVGQSRSPHRSGLACRALAGDWPEAPRHDGQMLKLVCRLDLDLFTGTAGWHRERHGYLRRAGGHAVLSRALVQGGRPADALWFDLDPIPVAELAAQHAAGLASGHLTHAAMVGLHLAAHRFAISCIGATESQRAVHEDGGEAERGGSAGQDRRPGRLPPRPAVGKNMDSRKIAVVAELVFMAWLLVKAVRVPAAGEARVPAMAHSSRRW